MVPTHIDQFGGRYSRIARSGLHNFQIIENLTRGNVTNFSGSHRAEIYVEKIIVAIYNLLVTPLLAVFGPGLNAI